MDNEKPPETTKCEIYKTAYCPLNSDERTKNEKCKNCELGREMDMSEND